MLRKIWISPCFNAYTWHPAISWSRATSRSPQCPPLAHPGDDSTLRKLPLHGPDGLEDVLEGVEIVEGVLPLTPSKPELSHLADQRSFVERGRECLMVGHAYEP